MIGEWRLEGVPRALFTDGWWLSDDGASPPVRRGPELAGLRPGRGLLTLILLVGLGDFLFYGQAVGLSLAVFAVTVFLAVPGSLARGAGPVLLMLLSVLPVVEHLQPLSLGFLVVGLCTSLLWVRVGAEAILSRSLPLLASLPLRGLRDGVFGTAHLAQSGALRDLARAARSWAFPIGGAAVLSGLLLVANPLLTTALSRLLAFDEAGILTIGRLCLWLGLALILWPLITPPPPAARLALPVLPQGLRPTARSVGRGLVVFNLILAVQTLTDALYLWGGASLPAGMTAAEYAHRGAYPLLVTALLAGAFAIAARPFAREDRQLRQFLLLWLAQNLALVLSALLRLELYVEAFGLTYLRLHSAIWMGLVAAGLCLIGWQVWRDRSNRWLLIRSFGLGLATLYACAFVNFAAIIARENLSRPEFDGSYVCDLGPTAAFEIRASGRELRVTDEYGDDLGPCPATPPRIAGWRDWGFRDWRVRRYLEVMPVMERQ